MFSGTTLYMDLLVLDNFCNNSKRVRYYDVNTVSVFLATGQYAALLLLLILRKLAEITT